MTLRTARICLLLLCVAHLSVTAARIHREPAPLRTFHDHDMQQLQIALVLSGDKRISQLPPRTHEPDGVMGARELWALSIANSPAHTKMYMTILPLQHALASLPSLALGVSPWTVRLGTQPLLWLLMALCFSLGRRLSGPAGGLAAAAVLAALPAAHTGTLVGTPVLGNMLGATLALWALCHSEGLARWGWAILAGGLVSLAPRWGESAGDGIEVLLVIAGPIVLTVLSIVVRRSLWGLAGLLMAGGVASVVMDRWWLEEHLSGYVLSEAGGAGGGASSFLSALRVAPWAYPEALLWSLAGPMGVLVLGLGALAGLRRLRWETVLLWAAAGGAIVALTLSLKRQDYYIAPILPSLAVLCGAGLASLGRAAWVAGIAAVSSAWLYQAHADLEVAEAWSCEPTVRIWLAADPLACGTVVDEAELFSMYHYFRDWRSPNKKHRERRVAIGDWATTGDGAAWLRGLPAGAVILLQRPMGQGSGADLLYYLLQSQRPDVHVHVLHHAALDPIAASLVDSTEDVWLITLLRNILVDRTSPEAPLRSLRQRADLVESGRLLHRHRIGP